MKSASAKTTLLVASGLGVCVAAHAANYSQNFDAFANGATSFGDGSALTNGGGTPASVQGQALELTNVAFGSTQNSFNIPALANSSLGFTVTFDVTLIDAAGGNPPADGFSFSYGNHALGSNYGEEGPGGSSISWVVDTWDNGLSDRGIRSKINGVNDFVVNFIPLADGQTVTSSITMSWDPTNGMSLSVSALGGPVFTNRPTPGFVPSDSHLFGFGARTGGATETVLLDNIVITTIPEPQIAALSGLAALGMIGLRRRRK
jgi:hypothetical protein